MTLELSEAQRELVDARREREELDGLIEGLEEKVRAGQAVEAEQELTAQYGLQRLAALRQEAAVRRVKDAEAAALQERRQAAVQEAQRELEELSPERLADACEEAMAAIERVQQLGDARQAAVARHARAFVDLGMTSQIVHRDRDWIAYDVGGVRYDTRQDHLSGGELLAAIEAERHRRALIPGRRAKGFGAPEPDRHPMALLLAQRAANNEEAA